MAAGIGFDFATTLLLQVLQVVNWTELAARERRKTHDVQQTEKMIPLITGETTFRQRVRELFFWWQLT